MLLLDHNLSYKIVYAPELNRVFPGLQHVYLLGMYNEEDEVIWNYAADNNLIIVSKDYDFQLMQLEKGPPPAVVKLSIGNCTNEKVKEASLHHESEIKHWRHDFGLIIIG